MSSRKNRLLDLLFRAHHKELLVFAGHRTGSDTAEDLVQDAYLRLLQQPDLEGIDNPRAYLFRTTSNLGINQFRKDEVRARYDGADEEFDADLSPSPQPGPDAELEGMLALDRLISVLDELPELYRDAFILAKLDGLTGDQVAKALGISPKSAQRYILKAWQHCLARLDR